MNIKVWNESKVAKSKGWSSSLVCLRLQDVSLATIRFRDFTLGLFFSSLLFLSTFSAMATIYAIGTTSMATMAPSWPLFVNNGINYRLLRVIALSLITHFTTWKISHTHTHINHIIFLWNNVKGSLGTIVGVVTMWLEVTSSSDRISLL